MPGSRAGSARRGGAPTVRGREPRATPRGRVRRRRRTAGTRRALPSAAELASRRRIAMTVPVSNKPFAVVLLCATLCSAGDRSIDRARVARRHGHAGRHPADLDRPRPDRQRLHLPLNQGDHGTRPHRPALGRSGRTRSGPRSPLGPVYGSRSCPTPPAVNDGVRVGVDGGAAQGRTAVSIPRVSMSGGLKSERLSSRSVFQRDHRIAASATTAVRGQVGADGPRSESGSAGALVPTGRSPGGGDNVRLHRGGVPRGTSRMVRWARAVARSSAQSSRARPTLRSWCCSLPTRQSVPR